MPACSILDPSRIKQLTRWTIPSTMNWICSSSPRPGWAILQGTKHHWNPMPCWIFFFHTSREMRRGGGVGILYRSTLNIKQLDRVSERLSYKCLECCLTSDSTLYRTILVHRSPTALSTLSFLDEFSDHLDETVYSGGNLIVLRDFNFHVDDTSDADATKFIDMIESYNVALHVSVSTHRKGALKDVLKTYLLTISFN